TFTEASYTKYLTFPEGVIEKRLDDGAVRGLDRHCNLSRRGFGLLKQPIAQLRQPGPAMREVALTHMSSLDIKQANAVALRCPVDPDEPLHIVDHCLRPPSFEAGHRDPDRSLYRRSRRDLLLDLDRGRSAGARVLRRCSRHRWVRLLPADRPVAPVYIVRLAAKRSKGYRVG